MQIMYKTYFDLKIIIQSSLGAICFFKMFQRLRLIRNQEFFISQHNKNMRSWKHLNTILNDIPIISVIFIINRKDKYTLNPVTWDHKVTTATNPSLPGRTERCQNDSPRCNQWRDGCQHDEPWPQCMFSDTFYKHTNLMQFNRIHSTYAVS